MNKAVPLLIGFLLPCLSAGAEGGDQDMAFRLRSSAIEPGGMISPAYTCDGRDISPPLRWEDPPAQTKSFALICEDPDAPMGTWVHWVVYNIPGSAHQLPEAVPPAERLKDGTTQGRNDFGKTGYGGPCPPRGKPHRYFFKLYALDTPPTLAAGQSRKTLLKAAEGHVLATAEFHGLYGRN